MKEPTFFTIESARYQELDFFTVKSSSLKHRADICVYKPENAPLDLPVVILLHGVYGSHWAWALKGNVHQTLKSLIKEKQIKPMLLVMPSDGLYGDGSGYLNHQNSNYEDWITKDLINLVKAQYPEVTDASPLFISGLSMGAYGALRLGTKNPDLFKAFSGLSAITDFEQLSDFVEDFENLKTNVLEPENVLDVIMAHKDHLKPFRFDCGLDDPLYASNLKLHLALTEANIKHEFYTNAGGHSWEYWTEHIKETLLFFNKY